MNPIKKFPTELKKIKYEIGKYAKEYGLDFFDVVFELLDYEQINVAAANGGFLVRYPHWRFGMDWEGLRKRSKYGLGKIYEMVINTDPCYAYLLEGNPIVDQKFVMAHVYGHCDFFKNNVNFEKTNRKMHDEMANHKTKIEGYIDKYGPEKIETFIDSSLSLENLIDYYSMFFNRGFNPENNKGCKEVNLKIPLSEEKDYLEEYINPKEYLKQKMKEIEEKKLEKKPFPKKPELDILNFLFENSENLEPWQRDILWMIREEAYYFAPQGRTKIMNEGWAAYWHSKIMTEKAVEAKEVIDYADHCSAVFRVKDRINPYKLGIEIYRYIEYKWDTGRHGKIYEECEDTSILNSWDEFVIFKNLYDKSKRNCRFNLEEALTEFFTFKENLKNGDMGFAPGIYSERDLVNYWYGYRKSKVISKNEKIKTIENEVNEAKNRIPLFDYFANFYKKTENLKLKSGRFDTFKKYFYEEQLGPLEKHYSLDELVEIWKGYPKFLEFTTKCRILDNFMLSKSRIPLFNNFLDFNKKYQEGKIKKVKIDIPSKWYEYADKYNGAIELNVGQKKLFDVRRNYSDITFLDAFIDDQFCKEQGYYYKNDGGYRDYDSNVIKSFLMHSLINGGNPYIYIVDANYKNRKELLLVHKFTGAELDQNYSVPTLKNLVSMWGRPVNLMTIEDDQLVLRRHDGENYMHVWDPGSGEETVNYFLKVNDKKILEGLTGLKRGRKNIYLF